MPDQRHLIQKLSAHISYLPEVQNQDVALFIDEVDSILEFDEAQNYELLELLRASFQHERCRVFFTGFRRVMEAIRNLGTPLYNFTIPSGDRTQPVRDARHIIGPMSRLGIDVSADLPAAILQETGGHPELIQMFCSEVVNFYWRITGLPTLTKYWR